jgi:radical SAM protein with 4Fe4S-binding SPASM domain
LNAAKPEKLYTHFKSLEVDTINFSPYLGGRDEVESLTPDDYYNFYHQIFDLWTEDPTPFKGIANLSDIVYNLFNIPYSQACPWSGTCFRSNLAIMPTGNIFPCLTLKDPCHCIGNVWEGSMDEIIKNPTYIQMYLSQKGVLQQCSSCECFSICRGGCRTASWRTLGRLDVVDPLCEGKKKLIYHIATKVYEEISGTSLTEIDALIKNEGFRSLHKAVMEKAAAANPGNIGSRAIAKVVGVYLQVLQGISLKSSTNIA